MSLIIKVERFGCKPTLIRTKAFEFSLGEDAWGLLSLKSPLAPWFKFEITSKSYAVLACEHMALLNGDRLQVGTTYELANGDILSCDDYTFTCFLTRSLAELYGTDTRFELTSISAGLEIAPPQISYSLISISKKYPILPGARLTIGSCENDSIHLPIPGVQPDHCDISFDGQELFVTSKNGAVSANGLVVNNNLKLGRSSQIRIEPLGLPLSIW